MNFINVHKNKFLRGNELLIKVVVVVVYLLYHGSVTLNSPEHSYVTITLQGQSVKQLTSTRHFHFHKGLLITSDSVHAKALVQCKWL